MEARRVKRGPPTISFPFFFNDPGTHRIHLFSLPAGQVRHFAGNWYILKTVEPNRVELGEILEGVAAFYRYCHEHGKVTKECYEEVATACQDLDYYQERINAFWEISNDGFQSWDAACPLQKITS